ncbi:MAG TPA: DUF748 domain-containing protein [Thermoanaerobaculaceae bacterium]|nr:DUF748 domain-containing protein [Thermoanaerobaculaceae bacterium]
MRRASLLAVLGVRARRWLFVGAGAVVLYAMVGFLVVAAVIKAQLPPRLGKVLGREVSLRSVRTNPFTLSVTLDGFLVKDTDGEAFVGWERLYVNAQISSVFTRTISFKAIDWTKPYGRVVLEQGGRLNFSDIVERLSKPEPGAPPKPPAKPRQVAIGHLAIRGATLVLSDRRLTEPFSTTLGPVSIELTGFRTERDSNNPYSFKGTTESGESFAWNGFFSLDPLRSEGRIDLENLLLPKYRPYYGDQVAFDLRGGTLSAQASYAFQWSADGHVCRVRDGSLDVRGLALGEPGREEPAVAVPTIEARGVEADLLAPSVSIGSLALRDGSVEATRLPDGGFDLVKLLTPKPHPKTDGGAELKLALRELAATGFRAVFDDRSTPRPVHALFEGLDVHVSDLDLDPAHSAKLTLATRINGRGTLRLEGSVAPLKPAFDLAVKAENVEVKPFDPYLEPAFDVRLNRGALAVDGRLRGAFEGRSSDSTSFAGDVRLDGFEAMDGAQREPFLRYRSLRLAGLDVRMPSRTLAIRSVELLEPESRLVVAPDRTSNVARALKLAPAGGGAGPPPPGAAVADIAPPTAPNPGQTPFEVAIVSVRIRGGRLAFVDRSLEPNAALLITDLDGSYTGLSSKPETQSAVEVKGRAGGLAPVLIQGRAMPLRHDKDTDVSLAIHGAELSDFGPYAGKYLGYTIRKGKLDVDARLTIKERRLDVQDKVRMDQFYLGDKTGSPDATKLPVKLALALLRDRNGVIELEVPIEGSLDDPDFRYGKAIWHAVVNVLTKIVTSPFALLGKMFGGGDADLSFASFEPGSSEPDPEAVKKAGVLAKALADRPDLSLEVEGTADPGADVAALKKGGLDRLLRETKAKALAAGQPGVEAETVTVAPEERETWLKAAFDAAFPAPPPEKGKDAAQVPPPPPAEMEQRLLGTITVSPDELRALAEARTKAVVALVLQGGAVDATRVFEVRGGERAAKEGGARVYFSVE